MTELLKSLYQNYDYYVNIQKGSDIVDEYFLVSSPIPCVCILGLYWYFVKVRGPIFMKDRKPYNLKKLLIAYNIFQVAANLYVFAGSIHDLFAYKYNVFCALADYSNTPKAQSALIFTWMYFLLKVLDLLDTVFFILRKKFNQVTVLHFYHHFLMVIVSYIAVRYLSGGHTCMIGLVNCFVHSVMYFYYLISCFKTELKYSIWWKKHITHIQLTQFVFLTFYFSYPLLIGDCQFPHAVLIFAILQNIIMFTLFSNFYYQTYIRRKSNID